MGLRSKILTLMGAVLFFGLIAQPAFAQEVIPQDNLQITQNTVLAPGTYEITDTYKDGVLIIATDNITLDCNSAVINGTDFTGFGIFNNGHHGVTIKNCNMSKYYYSLRSENSNNLTVQNNNFSGNRTIAGDTIFLNINQGPDISDGAHLGGGIYLRNSTLSNISGNTTENQQNGIDLYSVTNSTISGNHASNNIGWGIHLYASTHNIVSNNIADHVNRTCFGTPNGGCDTAGMLLVYGANNNQITGNRFQYGGDGFFIGNEWGLPSDNNTISQNDGSYSSGNAFEATFSQGNIFTQNTASFSNFGFWLGYSHHNKIDNNIMDSNNYDGVAIEHGHNNTITKNTIKGSKRAGINLWTNYNSGLNYPDRKYSFGNTITGNTLSANNKNIEFVGTTDSIIKQNNIADSGVSFYLGQADINGELVNSQNNTIESNNFSCTVPPQVNLALGKPTNANKSPESAYKAVDGDKIGGKGQNYVYDYTWYPGTLYPGDWWQVDLGEIKTVQTIVIYPYVNNTGDWLDKFHVVASNTGQFSGEQTTVLTVTNSPNEPYNIHTLSAPVQTRYLRIIADEQRNWIQLQEFEVYQEASINIYNCQYHFYNNQPGNVIAENNWWGTTDSAIINTRIYDSNDNASVGTVDYLPYLNAPVDLALSPVADAGPDQIVVDSNNNGVEAVTLDGSSSYDPDGTIVAYEWKEGTTVLGTMVSITPTLAVGTYNITLTVVDNSNKTGSDTVKITVKPLEKSVNLTIVDGYDQKNQKTLQQEGRIYVVQTSDSERWETEKGYYTSYQFSNPPIPSGARITSVAVFVKHYEEYEFQSGKLEWNIGTGWPNSPTVWGSNNNVPLRITESDETTDSWNVSNFVDSLDKINQMELRVKNNDTNKKTKVNYIYAELKYLEGPPPNQLPVANAGGDQTLVDADGDGKQTVILDASLSYDPDGTIATYEWKEGTTVLGITVGITKDFSLGSHNIDLAVTDNGGASATDRVVITVKNPNKPPLASAGADKTVNENQSITFDASASTDPDGTIVSYHWNFGNGSTADGKIVSYAYPAQGSYTVLLTVTDNEGTTGSDTALVTVNNLPPTANAGPDQTAYLGDTLIFDGSGSSDTASDLASLTYNWNFGDSQLGIGKTVTHSYGAGGSYTVTLTVTDNNGATATDTATVTINPKPTTPKEVILKVSDGYDEKIQKKLSQDGKTYVVQASDGNRWETEFGYYTAYEFADFSFSPKATITSVAISVEHHEEQGFTQGKLEWKVGPNPSTVWGSSNPSVREEERNETTDFWDITSLVNTPERINSLQLIVKNNDNVNKKKAKVNYLFVKVNYLE